MTTKDFHSYILSSGATAKSVVINLSPSARITCHTPPNLNPSCSIGGGCIDRAVICGQGVHACVSTITKAPRGYLFPGGTIRTPDLTADISACSKVKMGSKGLDIKDHADI